MKLVMCATFDKTMNAFVTPFFAVSTAMALRDWATAARDPQHMFNACPQDFDLYEIGVFDQDTGKVDSTEPVHVASAETVVSTHNQMSIPPNLSRVVPGYRPNGGDPDAKRNDSPVQSGSKSGDPA